MPRPRPPVDKSFSATAKLLAIPLLLTALLGYLGLSTWYGEHRAESDCEEARTAHSLGEFRAALQARAAPWSEGRLAADQTLITTDYPGPVIETYVCMVYTRAGKIVGTEVAHHD
jgi:hypothetical protein